MIGNILHLGVEACEKNDDLAKFIVGTLRDYYLPNGLIEDGGEKWKALIDMRDELNDTEETRQGFALGLAIMYTYSKGIEHANEEIKKSLFNQKPGLN